MKIILFFLAYINFLPISYAQYKDLHILSSAGSTYHTNELTLDWTIGEVVVSSLENASMVLSQGFHQSTYSYVSVHPIPEDVGSALIFPNPFSDELEFHIQYTLPQSGELQLFDFSGKEIWSKPFEGTDITENFSTTSFPAGTYLFVVSIPDKPFVYTYQLVKIQ